jgi:CRISPR/Cas system endoribonuclease Cas6 (RAMP superfamily)
MKLGGVIGSINFSYIDEESFKLLKLGEIIGVGKQVTFGLGCIKVF